MEIKNYHVGNLDTLNLCIGKQGEHLAKCFRFDVSEWQKEYPSAKIVLYVKLDGYAGYLGSTKLNGEYIEWPITNSDTKYAGCGSLEMCLLNPEDDTVIKSHTCRYRIIPSPSSSAPSTPPPPGSTWWQDAVNTIHGSVRYDEEQGLTEAQKRTARRNIGVSENGTSSGDGVSSEQVQDAVNEALEQAKNSGMFDGEDGTSVTITKITESSVDGGISIISFSDGKTLSVRNGKTGATGAAGKDGYTPVKGIDYFDGAPGTPGKDGYTPVKGTDYRDGKDGADGKDGVSVTVSKVAESHVDGGSNIVTFSNGMTLAVKNGHTGAAGAKGADGYTPVKNVDYFDGKNGKDGAPGADGFSPTVTLTRESDGVTIKATNKSGTSTAKVYDGKDGSDGTGGSSLPTGEAPHQMLVTDADGNAKWVDRTHYDENVDFEVLPEMTIALEEGQGFLTSPPTNMPIAGTSHVVNYNGTVYECVGFSIEEDGLTGIGVGNPAAVGGEVTTEPFAIIFLPPEVGALEGAYALCLDYTGASEMTVSINANGSLAHPLGMQYIPNEIKEHMNLNIRNGASPGSLEMPLYSGMFSAKSPYCFTGGYRCQAYGLASFAFGNGAVAGDPDWLDINRPGDDLNLLERAGIAMGHGAMATGRNSVALGGKTSKATSDSAFAIQGCEASGVGSFAAGYETVATKAHSFVFGSYNIIEEDDVYNPPRYIHVIGNGRDGQNRSNAHTLDQNGNAWYQGNVYVGGTSQDEGKKLATVDDIQAYVDEAILGGEW